jgi:CheY-like chemotaxis protein
MPTVLVVDDNLAVRTGVGFALRQDGFSVLFAADGETAIQLYRQNIDLVLLNLEMGGLRTLFDLQKMDPKVRCCFLTRNADCPPETVGAAPVFQKPILNLEKFSKELGELARLKCLAH